MNTIRADYILSYWIFIWYLLYIIGIIKFNPKLSIIIGIIHNILLFILLYLYNCSRYKLIRFIIINSLIKLIPLYTLRNTKIIYLDYFIFLILLFVYLLYIYIIDGNNFIKINYEMFRNYLDNNSQTFVSTIYDNIYNKIFS